MNGSDEGEEGVSCTQFRPHCGLVSGLQWVPGQPATLSSAASDGYVRVWDLNKLTVDPAYCWFDQHDHASPRAIVTHCWLNPNLLVCAKEDGLVQILDRRVGRRVVKAFGDLCANSVEGISDRYIPI